MRLETRAGLLWPADVAGVSGICRFTTVVDEGAEERQISTFDQSLPLARPRWVMPGCLAGLNPVCFAIGPPCFFSLFFLLVIWVVYCILRDGTGHGNGNGMGCRDGATRRGVFHGDERGLRMEASTGRVI